MRKTEARSVYAILGLADHESMDVKASLASLISDVMRKRRLTQSEASEIIGMSRRAGFGR